MSEKLSKYSQTQNIASDTIKANDTDSPYSFKQWVERNTGTISGKEKAQYENYLKQWYTAKQSTPPTSERVKEDYIQLLRQLAIAFKTESGAEWVADVDYTDPDDLEQVIPFYATRLKEIAIYLINKREAIRRAKLKYNMAGTYSSIERVFYEYLLKAFTKRKTIGDEYITSITDVSVFNAIPELSAVGNGFQVLVEELYDDASYFDRDPTLPVSAYFSFSNSATTYLDSLNIAPSDYEWLYSTGVANLCADNPLLWAIDDVLNQYKGGVPLSALELYDSNILNDYNRIKLAQKYLGETQYIVSGGYWMPWVDTIDFTLARGNNWFYWLSGENAFENETTISIDALPLTAANLIGSGATAGINITGSDVLYVIRDDKVSGAWLRLTDKISLTPVMSAKIAKGKTVFAFPFPGYGLSGEDLPWTGKSLNNLDQTFYYLDKATQKAVFDTYWNTTTSSISAFDPIYIYDTTLAVSNAKAATKFSEADYVVTRPALRDAIPDYVYSGDQEYAWLYKMQKTDIPIKSGGNNIYWPLERYGASISMIVSSDQCNPLSLSGIDISDFIGAVAGTVPNEADKVFKRTSPNSTKFTEGAWLKGVALNQPLYITDSAISSGCGQPNIAMRVLGGAYGSFIWQDPITAADNVFRHVPHQHDCWYLESDTFSLFKERPTQNKDLNYNQWQDCTCRAVLYSPLGHPGNAFDDYDRMADFIVAVTTAVSSFSFIDWRGPDGLDYRSSTGFGWFKLNGQIAAEPDVGWGSGSWITNTGNPFMLSAGVMYLYFRNDMHRDNPNSEVPYLIGKYKTTSTNASWKKLYLDKLSGEWLDAGVDSDMLINAGDMLYYDHQETYALTLTSSRYEFSVKEVAVTPDLNRFSVVSNFAQPDLPVEQLIVPVQALEENTPLTNSTFYTLCNLNLSYYTMPTGTVTVSGSFVNLIPQTTTTILSTITSVVIDHYTYTNESINFVLNVPLSGWMYSDGSQGAKPIWVTASDEDDDFTKQKRVDIWSGSQKLVDDYNFVTQPPHSNMAFRDGMYVEYNRREGPEMLWVQQLRGTESTNVKQWCKVLFNTDGVSNLSAHLYNNVDELIVSATDVISDITLDIIQDRPLRINYYARNAFTWSQEISNSSLGLPPTGGVWVPIKTGQLISPLAPYAHLSNRHYPTYASVPSMDNLYSTKDSGGYFIPRMLGVSTAVSKNLVNEVNTSKISNAINQRGSTAIYRNLDVYTSDRGLTNTDQFSPISAISVDSSWMKASITEGKKAGLIVGTRQHQEFIPYQTKYETQGSNDNGVYRQGADAYDPWFKDTDSLWENPIDWPANWRKQYDIQGWYDQQDKGSLQVYQWKTDIFGNQYALLKDAFMGSSIYDKKHNINGSLWTRNTRNIIQPAMVSMKEVFKDVLTLDSISNVSGLISAGILDFDVWYDTLMLYTSSTLFLFHLNFDYDTGIISSISDETNYISMRDSKFGGTWLHEEDKIVTICTLLSCGNQIRPVLRSLNLESNELTVLYNISAIETDMSGYNFTTFDHPVFTYDHINKVYNISYIAYSGALSGMHVTTINVADRGNCHKIHSAKTIVPET
jgi:hypothetical protein